MTALVALSVAIAVLAPVPATGQAVDMLGREVVPPRRPARVVSLAPSLTEIVYALGAADVLVGVTEYCDFPPEVAGKPRVGGIYTPSLEKILALRPDLVLATTEGNRQEHVRMLERLGIPVFVVRPTGFSSVLESIQAVGRVLGRAEAGADLARSLAAQADEITRSVAGAPRSRVLYVVWGNPLIVPGRDTLITDLVRRAGGESVSAGEALDYPRLSMEEALARRPEVVVLGQQRGMAVMERLDDWPHLQLLPAVREGRVHAIDGDLTHRPGPRVIEGLRILARLLHPEVAR